jgi:hypothetical protein
LESELPWWKVEDAVDSRRDGGTMREQLGAELAGRGMAMAMACFVGHLLTKEKDRETECVYEQF